MGLQIADLKDDPIVRQTLKAFSEALSGDEGGGEADYPMPPVDDMPGVRALLETDALDSVCAAVLSVGPLTHIISVDDIEKKLDPRVAETLRLLDGDATGGPEELLKAGNPHILKLLVASIAGSTDKDELRGMASHGDPMEIKMMANDLSDFILAISEHMIDNGAVKDIPPKLMDKFIEGIGNLSAITPSRTHKRVLTDITRELKEAVVKAAAVEVTVLTAPPVIDPASPFEKLKNDARKFKPGGLNG